MSLSEDARLIVHDQRLVAHVATVSLARLQAGIGRLGVALTNRRRRAREAEILATFSDRELWDLGLSRADLPAITSGTYRRD